MKLTFIANACCIYESEGYKLLADPWLTDGAFYGAWFHYPPLKTRPENLADYDALYISHLHPDHFDPKTLRYFPKDRPLIILDSSPNFLEKMARREGFTNIKAIKDGETLDIGPFVLTMFKPFVKHPFFECQVGNIIDSALVVSDGDHTILNANDNTPDIDSAHMLKERFGKFDIAQLNYNAAGPYPACFSGINKEAEHSKVLLRNLDHMAELAKVLEPRFVQPFAGAFVLGGKNWEKNEVLGTTTQTDAATYIRHQIPKQKTLCLKEGESFDCASEESPKGDGSGDCGSQSYIECILSTKKYDYEDSLPPPIDTLNAFMRDATINLGKAQERLNCYPDCSVIVNDLWTVISAPRSKNVLRATLDTALLWRILNRKAHWNNAEIGCHIEFERDGEYQPDVHMLLSFLHAG